MVLQYSTNSYFGGDFDLRALDCIAPLENLPLYNLGSLLIPRMRETGEGEIDEKLAKLKWRQKENSPLDQISPLSVIFMYCHICISLCNAKIQWAKRYKRFRLIISSFSLPLSCFLIPSSPFASSLIHEIHYFCPKQLNFYITCCH